MPVTYRCDHCGAAAPSLDNWLVVSITYLHYVPDMQPTGRTQDMIAPDLLFDKATCRDAWCAKADVKPPPSA
jgi:hypothetical protein